MVARRSKEVVCNWRAQVLVPTATAEETTEEVVLSDAHRLLAEDLAFLAYVLGKDGGLGHYCPHYPLTKQQWILPSNTHPVVNLWTLDELREIFHNCSKKGAQKIGVKSLPKITHIEVDGFVLPLTHMGLGIDNNVIAAYEDRVEAHIVKVPPDNQGKLVRLEELDGEIKENWEAV